MLWNWSVQPRARAASWFVTKLNVDMWFLRCEPTDKQILLLLLLLLSSSSFTTPENSTEHQNICIAEMRPIATDVTRSTVCMYVGHECAVRKRQPIEMPFGGPNEPCIRLGLKSLLVKGNFDGYPAVENHWILLRCTQQKDKSWTVAGMTAPLLQPTAMLPTGRCHCHITLSPVKNPPTAMRPFVKILGPLDEM